MKRQAFTYSVLQLVHNTDNLKLFTVKDLQKSP